MNELQKKSGESKSALPDIAKLTTRDIASGEEKEREMAFLNRCQNVSNLLNSQVEKKHLKKHPLVDSHYLPISYMEMMLDEYFFGLWGTENFHWQIVANEIVASLELVVYHPVLKQWLKRTGAAAHQIMCDAIPREEKEAMSRRQINEYSTDLGNKKPAALTMGGFAALKAECFTNAVLSLGKVFGRDVNRDAKSPDYMPTIKDPQERKEELRQAIGYLLNENQDEEEKQQIIDKILKAEEEGKNTINFYNSILKKLRNDG